MPALCSSPMYINVSKNWSITYTTHICILYIFCPVPHIVVIFMFSHLCTIRYKKVVNIKNIKWWKKHHNTEQKNRNNAALCTMGEGCGVWHIHYCETKGPIHGFVKTLRSYHPPYPHYPPTVHILFFSKRTDWLVWCIGEKYFFFYFVINEVHT